MRQEQNECLAEDGKAVGGATCGGNRFMIVKRWSAVAVAAWLMTVPLGCQTGDATKEAAPPPPPAKVVVSRPMEQMLAESREYTGHLAAVETVAIQARVRGVLTEIHFQEGTEVQKGELLYEIDPSEYAAAVEEQTSEVNRLEHEVELAGTDAKRASELLAKSASSREDWETKQTTLLVSRSQLDKARAALKLAQINLSYTKIYAPIAGRIGRTLVTKGNLVGYGEPTMLTTVVQMDPVYVYYEIPERDLLRMEQTAREKLQAQTTAQASAETSSVVPSPTPSSPAGDPASRTVVWQAPIAVGLETEVGHPHQGVTDFRDNQVQSETGTVLVRATLENQDRKLVPGLFARIQMKIGDPQSRLLVPQTALGADQRGRFVLVVNEQNVVQQRPVRIASNLSQDGYLIVQEGVTATDRIVVSGLQKARPGATVEPELTTSTTSPNVAGTAPKDDDSSTSTTR